MEATVSTSEVTMKRAAAAVVSLLRNVVAPLPPKSVWLEPPKAAPSSAPLPPCTRTTNIRKMQTSTCTIDIRIIILSSLEIYQFGKTHGLKARAAHKSAVHIRARHQGVYIVRLDTAAIQEPCLVGQAAEQVF